VAGAAHVGAVAAGPERLERARLDLAGVVALDRADAVVGAEHEAVLQPLGGEEALLLSHPFLQPAVRHDLQRHATPPWTRFQKAYLAALESQG
jgi:hypothetical protein